MGLPTIATNWSGNTAFMHDNNSLLIPVEKLVERNREDMEGRRWAEPSVSGLRKLMRKCVNEPAFVKELGRNGRATMVEQYNPQRVGALVLKELREEWREKKSASDFDSESDL